MYLSAAAQAGLDRFRAAFAASASLSDEELWRPHAVPPRLGQPRTPKPRSPRPREGRTPPKLSRQYLRAMATTVIRDQRLTPNASRLAGLLRALIGDGHFVETTRARLGGTLNLSSRTITRLLGELVRYGYIVTERTKTRTGSDAGLRIYLQPRILPYYELAPQDWQGADTGTGHGIHPVQSVEQAGRTNESTPVRTQTEKEEQRSASSAPDRPPDRGAVE